MRGFLFKTGCMVFVVLFGVGALPSGGFPQTGIVVSPENPSEFDSLEVTINAESTTNLVLIDNTSFEVTDGLIKIITDVTCGPWYMMDPYTITVVVPPVVADTYNIQYWSTEGCHLGLNPILSSEIVVSPEPIATERTTWGAIKALWQ